MNTDGNTPYPQNLTFKFGESVAVGQFSSIHQEVMASLREQTRGDFCCSTCSSCDTCSTDTWEALGIDEGRIMRATPQPLPALVERQIVEKLGEVVLERREKRERSLHSPGEESHTPRPRSRPRTAPDNMSGLWNMLATYDDFFVTPPGFNLYQQDKPHWLDQEPIPWEVREKARRKCVKWLNNYHN
ncbi:hypothetical protein J6590_093290 [Homalodisca vitripennis]|nr:hypothetical protein J6590_048872 [Homalodisca vitripennis]KAG8334314.1 hypothetical protein J6590_093290 [Homalodisca vitripennis]